MYLSERQKISLKRIIVFILSLVLIIEAFFQYGQQAFVKAKEQAEAKYALYIDTSMVGVDAELLENGIGAYFYDAYGNASSESPIIMEKVGDRDHLYKVDIDEQYSYVTFTEGTDSNTAECTSRIAIDWGLGVPCFKLNSENVADGGTFYGLYTVYFDTNNVVGSETFTENGVGVYAYNSETESYSSTPVAMKESDKGEGIYEYSFDQPYQYIAFMNGYDNWNYSIATSPVYTEWGYAAPCFLLQTVNGEASTGLWWDLTSVVYFDASEIKKDDAFVENGVYLYAYNEKENGEKELLSDTPVKMLASGRGEDMYEYTLDKPYENVQYILGDSFDAAIQSEVIAIDWLNYAEPCYKMILERTDEVSVSSSDAEEVEIGSIEVPPKSEVENVSDEEALQPMDEARVTADGLSAIRVSHTMEWLGANNTLSANTVSSNDTNTTDESTTDEDDTDGTDTDGDSTDESTTEESTTGDVQVDGELTDIGGDATTATVAAAVTFAAARSASSSITVYFDAGSNDGNNGWTTSGTVYIYYDGITGSSVPVAMTESKRSNPSSTGTLWEHTVPADCKWVIFSNKGSWTTTGKDYNAQTVDVTLYSSALYPCYKLGSSNGETPAKRTVVYVKDLGPLSQAGKSMYFYDMTGTVAGDVTAVFTNENGTKVEVSADKTTGAYVIPADVTVNSVDYPYTTVAFQVKNADGTTTQLGATYNFFNDSSSGAEAFLYDESTSNTFFYGITEKKNSDGSTTFISDWGTQSTGSTSIAGKKIYFDKLFFPAANGGQFQIGNGTPVDLAADADDAKTLSYTIPSDVTADQQTILTFIASDGTKYHFQWSDLGTTGSEIDKVTLNYDIANVTEKYVKGNTIYYDATLSKLSYAGSGGKTANGIPYVSAADGATLGVVYYYATSADGKTKTISGTMEKAEYGTWKDTYKVDLPEEYTRIRFSGGYAVTNETAWANGDATAMWDIPTDIENPCFYGDTSDDVIYNGGNRGGYWDEVYTVRDPNKEKAVKESATSADVVEIAEKTFTRAQETKYVNSTFYDYYSDYELNGLNRDNYASIGTTAFSSYRTWYPFRQLDQALSDYYEDNGVNIPLYTGHFQPNNLSYQFQDIADTLGLYGWSSSGDTYNSFISTNNSLYNAKGAILNSVNARGYYAYAAQKLVSSELKNGTVQSETSKNSTVALPYFDANFLTGNNSKNTVLGEVYENVAFPFTKKEIEGVEYWYFDSSETNLELKKDSTSNVYYLDTTWTSTSGGNPTYNSSSKGASTGENGFFPFNNFNQSGYAGKLNYGYGTKLEIKFRLTSDGTVLAQDGTTKKNIVFTFAGDDDVWVFIDGKLALDVGGDHAEVSGTIDFGGESSTKTATVSAVKNSAGYTPTNEGSVTTEFTLEGNNTDEHTLTMFYMERGMWESNMRITYNFPDENQLEVEKVVDDSAVNQELFEGVFDGESIFPFTIQNQATHYGEVGITSESEDITISYNADFDSGTIDKNTASNYFEKIAEFTDASGTTTSNVVHWKALWDDKTQAYQEARWGIIKPASGTSIDVSTANHYLQFKYYYDETGTPTLNNMYIMLKDSSGHQILSYLYGKTYGSAVTQSKKWTTITLDLEKIVGENTFDYTQITEIGFGYDYEADFYLDDFVFKSITVKAQTGFVTQQYDIPSYDSVAAGGLVYPKGAQYTLTTAEGATSIGKIGADGQFTLADGESVVFRDQFRRGSYIALKEEVNSDVFDTWWTMYEDGMVVTSMSDGSNDAAEDTVILANPVPSMVKVSGYEVDDGRTEKYLTGTTDNESIANEGYTTEKRPTTPSFVFRSYSDPDTTTGLTKLKVVYTNKVKVGSLTLTKSQATGSSDLTGEYTFTVTFTNVAGMGLEGNKTITKTITLKKGETAEITGIPVNTEFTIVETTPGDKSYLQEVKSDQNYTFTFETGEVKGKIEEAETTYAFEFVNMLKPVIDINLEKKWQDASGTTLTTGIPTSIYVRVQRRVKGSDDGTWSDFDLDNQEEKQEGVNTIEISPGYGEWKRSITNLWKYVNGTDKTDGLWEYRIVELEQTTDSDGNITYDVIEDGGVLGDFQVIYPSNAVSGSLDVADTAEESYDYVITNMNTVSLQITKTNKDKEALSEVEFKLEKQTSSDPETWKTVETSNEDDTLVTDDKGICTFKDLPFGTYRLTEIKTVEGYTLLKDPVIIVIYENGYKVDDTTYEGIENDLITVDIVNSKNIVLPATGWSSPISLATGIILLSICLALCLMYRCKISKSRREGKPPG